MGKVLSRKLLASVPSILAAERLPFTQCSHDVKNSSLVGSSYNALCVDGSPTSSTNSLLGYPIRRAAADEMLYGGIRVSHLVQPVFPLRRIKSELLPSPSLQREREDLELEMQLPRHTDPTQLPSHNVQRYVSGELDEKKESKKDGFNMSEFFNDLYHPSLHHNSSLPYDRANNTNNVLALRLFPVNIGIRDRTEAIRLRTHDCLERVQQWRYTARLGLPTQFPMPLPVQDALKKMIQKSEGGENPRTLYSGALNVRERHTRESLPHEKTESSVGSALSPSYLPHLRNRLCFHPSPSSLSIFTRPQDQPTSSSFRSLMNQSSLQMPPSLLGSAAVLPSDLLPEEVRHRAFGSSTSSWMPFQMLKPVGYNWSPTRRSSGTRGPSAQLVQERLDQKGFGWKKKSRYLWQQDIDTAGFRPHRFF